MNEPLQDAILNGLYDATYPGHELLSPKLLQNTKNDKIWLTLRQELLTCRNFTWAVAFITQDMLVPFKVVMADLAVKGIKGTIITGDYLAFNNPQVFHELMKIPNLTVKIAAKNGFHAKGYLLEHDNWQTIVIGSANFTRAALLSNYEWALKVSSREDAALAGQLASQLQQLQETSVPLTPQWLQAYEANWVKPVSNSLPRVKQAALITPNQMQTAALKELKALVDAGQKRGLVVSATGTGKTYLGAFAVKDFAPRKFLYVVHREQIAKKALESFYQVIGGERSNYGLLTGHKHQLGCQYLFATVQTLSQPELLASLEQDEFDYILIDEAHRAAAPSYQRVFDHFTPKFWLGMTATPERMDDQDVYQLFDYNLAYEIRLRDALEEKMLAPFHYVGVEDYEADGESIDETTNLRHLVAPKRVDYVLKQIDYYGYCGNQARGLVFCSRQEEARELAQLFTAKGHAAIALTNEDSEARRAQVVKQLETGQIEYIVTVDLFNEGIDIPSLNQIVMLRNTQSSIVFIQQLGRGLRKFPGKDYVTVIDFIGNYKNNYLIPIALNQDSSRSQDKAREESTLPGLIDVSTINFSRIASEKILASLDQVKLDGLKELRQSYQDLQEKIGRPPLLFDFYQHGSTSPEVFANNHSLQHYGQFLSKMGETVELNKYENAVLSFVTKELLNGKRPHELRLLQLLLAKGQVSQEEYEQALRRDHAYVDAAVLTSVEAILSLSFFDIKQGKTTKKAQYGDQALIMRPNLLDYCLAPQLQQALEANMTFKKLFVDVVKTGLLLNQEYDNQAQFTLYQQYDRKDVCRLLNWPKDVSAPMYGYRVDERETPIFITYKKDSAEKRNAVYHNTLEDGRSLRWYTRSPRHLDSDEVQRLLNSSQMKLHLFVKKSDAIGKQFFYLGEADIQKETVKEELLGPKKKAAVGMNLLLKHPLEARMYELLFAE
ncbi:DEAD/DEAH box helicase [Lactobacillus sp. ESL0731]|uniref:DUF3427 domain-containing protein n=1 Tax=unclassified Lactobacillus TaxID=2620435 RepID=UPI0023F635CC|nr:MULTISPECIES: DEAD/DEAH box helicase [unclassified Lactobacillus]WEV51190.1 DEAD/DEAH box helicase [Lactobacillus sp. ESL0700]WEV62320.1 DEAD/DEAH box helicase [Lactobacillus sp. ESL0731]